MRISGFTIVRNGTQFDYPYLESLRSLLPLVDELIINVGKGDDDTPSRVSDFCSKEAGGKASYFESDWGWGNPEKMKAGLILSEQTNLALSRCRGEWCVYLQADEVLHEEDISILKATMERCAKLPEVEALIFEYVHFYGSYQVEQKTRSAYRREIRAFKRSSGAQSVGDAQSFRQIDGSKLRAIHSGVKIYHYGWVRPPEVMRAKTFHFDQIYHGYCETKADENPHTGDNYKYKRFWGLRPYHGTHPTVMLGRIARQGWNWNLRSSPWVFKVTDFKKVVMDTFERWTGVRLFEYQCYRLISPKRRSIWPLCRSKKDT